MYKRAAALPLLASLVFPVMADDAKMLPEGVLRTIIAPSQTTVDEVFDDNGDRQDTASGQITATTLSLALEYGVNDWITAGLQWAPGYVLSGGVEDNDSVDLSGANDIFLGAKLSLLGKQGLSPSDNMRFAITPGIKIPLSTYDAAEERQNIIDSKDFKTARTDRGAWGLGPGCALRIRLPGNA